jgi:hypothetical protein
MTTLIDTYLGKRFSLRNILQNASHHNSTSAIPKADLTPEKEPTVAAIVAALAKEIAAHPDSILLDEYDDDDDRARDWRNLTKEDVLDASGALIPINIRRRPGHNILDHHMPHFWDVRNHRGNSVRSSITEATIEKALWQNLQNHSTPYASELRRMIINTCALGSVTKYRALTTKAIVRFFGATRVLDPCAGWGGRLLGTLAAGATYLGCEPDPQTAAGLRAILADTAIPVARRSAGTILEQPAEIALPTLANGSYDLILTSPPYFNMELYNGEQQSLTSYTSWDTWTQGWLRPVITAALEKLTPSGVSCWSVKNIKTDRAYPLADVVKQIHADLGYTLVKTVVVRGCGRMGVNRIGDDGKETRKSEEETFCFRKPTLSEPEPETNPTTNPTPTTNYSTLAVHALRDLWRQRGFRGFSTKTKEELIARLEAGV